MGVSTGISMKQNEMMYEMMYETMHKMMYEMMYEMMNEMDFLGQAHEMKFEDFLTSCTYMKWSVK